MKKFIKAGAASGSYTSLAKARENIQDSSGNPAKTPLFFEANPFNEYIENSKNILDIGCGMGRMAQWVLENTSANYYGLDPNTDMLKYFWEYNNDLQPYIDNIYITSDIYDTKLKSQQYDVVLSFFVFQHIGSRVPEGAMNINDITQEILKNTHKDTIWFLLEHENEEAHWFSKWINDNNMTIKFQCICNDIYSNIKDHYILIAQHNA